MHIGVPLETHAGETRVAATPETLKKLIGQGHQVTVQSGAGVNASVPDAAYEAVGAIGHFHMTKKEADLMRLFYDNQNEVLDRDRILHAVWGYTIFPQPRSIDNFVLFLRQKFEKDSKNPQHFKAVRGVGYRFTP